MSVERLIYIAQGGLEKLRASFTKAQVVLDAMGRTGSQGGYVILISFDIRLRINIDSEWDDVQTVFTHRLELLSNGDPRLRKEYKDDGLLIGDKELKGDRLMEFS